MGNFRVTFCLGGCFCESFLCHDIWPQFFKLTVLLVRHSVNQGSSSKTAFCLFVFVFVFLLRNDMSKKVFES